MARALFLSSLFPRHLVLQRSGSRIRAPGSGYRLTLTLPVIQRTGLFARVVTLSPSQMFGLGVCVCVCERSRLTRAIVKGKGKAGRRRKCRVARRAGEKELLISWFEGQVRRRREYAVSEKAMGGEKQPLPERMGRRTQVNKRESMGRRLT